MKWIGVLLLWSSTAFAQAPNAIGPTLVSEGEFAVRLAAVLDVAQTDDALTAEDRLDDVSIAPTGGWVEDMPITPSTLAELRNAINAAYCYGPNTGPDVVCNGRMEAFYSLVDEMGLSIDTCNGQCSTQPVSPPQLDPTEVNTYYAINGPPIITYYTPPIYYFGLYAWLPFPFWWGGYYWPGYWMLRDFDRHTFYNGRPVIISNHYRGRDGVVVIIDPIRRHHGIWHNPDRPIHHPIMRPVEPIRRPPIRIPHNPGHVGFHGGHGR